MRVAPWSIVLACAPLLVCAPAPAAACSCAERDIAGELVVSTAIFEGVVDSIDLDPASGTRTVRLAVTQTWRGARTEHVELRTDAAESTCGFPFEVGRAYLVYATGDESLLRVSLCSRTRLMDDAGADRAALGSGVVPIDVRDEDVEPVRPPRTAPSRGGCASCSVTSRERGWWPLGALALVALSARRARGARA